MNPDQIYDHDEESTVAIVTKNLKETQVIPVIPAFNPPKINDEPLAND